MTASVDHVAEPLADLDDISPAASRRRWTRRRKTAVYATRTAFLAGVLILWQFAPGSIHDVLGDPVAAIDQLRTWLLDGTLERAGGQTLTASVVGLLLGSVAGVVGATLLAFSRLLDAAQRPIMRFLYAVPKVALLPLFVLWFGVGLQQRVALVTVTTFFFMFYAARNGLHSTPAPLESMMRTLGCSRLVMMRTLYLPASLEWILSGLRIALPYSLVAAVSAELLSGTTGLGALMRQSSQVLDPAGVVAAIFATAVISLLFIGLYRLIVRSIPWVSIR